jgi:hypothetical protein
MNARVLSGLCIALALYFVSPVRTGAAQGGPHPGQCAKCQMYQAGPLDEWYTGCYGSTDGYWSCEDNYPANTECHAWNPGCAALVFDRAGNTLVPLPCDDLTTQPKAWWELAASAPLLLTDLSNDQTTAMGLWSPIA